MRAARIAAGLLAVASLPGCVPMANFTMPDGEPSARVQVARKATPSICVDERQAQLVPDAEGYATVPAGRPITLAAQWEGHDFACIPAVTLTLEPGASYLQQFSVRSRACTTTVAKETGAGLVPVATSEAGSYGCRGRP